MARSRDDYSNPPIDTSGSTAMTDPVTIPTSMPENGGKIAVPTLVVHGKHDPIFPTGHAEALAREVPDGELLVLEQAGHLLTRATWDTVVPAMLAHTSGAPTRSRSRTVAG